MNTKLLRQKILDLAIRGKLTEQKKSDGTTKDLLAQISKQWLVSSKQDSQKENASSNVIASTTSTSSRTPIRDPFAASKNSDDVIASTAKQSKKKTFAPKEIIPLDKSEAPFEIPENWEWVRLGDLCELISGQDFPPEKYNAEGKGLPYITGASNFDNTHVILNRWTEFPSVIAYKGDILLVCKGSGYGNYMYADFDKAHIARQIMAIRIENETLKSYVYHFIGSQYEFLKSKGNGLVPGIARSVVLDIEIPLPPLAEQQRIVATIENAFAEITEIENNQELLKKHIKQGRQKILDLAIRGRLTQQLKTDGTTKDLLAQISKQWLVSSKQDSQKENASFNVIANTTSTSSRTPIRDPFAASKNSDDVIASEAKQSKKKTFAPKQIIPLDKSEAPFEIPETWEWVRLGDVLDIARGGSPRPIQDYLTEEENGLNWIKIGDTEKGGKYIESVKEKIKPSGLKHTRAVKAGDFLLTNSMSFGRPYILKVDGCIHDGWLVLGEVEKSMIPDFLYYMLSSDFIYQSFSLAAAGSTVKNLKSETVQATLFPLPPLAEQQRIVAAIESAFTEFDAMEKGIL